jgi:hypothetical protein
MRSGVNIYLYSGGIWLHNFSMWTGVQISKWNRDFQNRQHRSRVLRCIMYHVCTSETTKEVEITLSFSRVGETTPPHRTLSTTDPRWRLFCSPLEYMCDRQRKYLIESEGILVWHSFCGSGVRSQTWVDHIYEKSDLPDGVCVRITGDVIKYS